MNDVLNYQHIKYTNRENGFQHHIRIILVSDKDQIGSNILRPICYSILLFQADKLLQAGKQAVNFHIQGQGQVLGGAVAHWRTQFGTFDRGGGDRTATVASMPCQVILAEAFVFAQFFQTQWIKQYFPVINKQLGHKAPDSNVAR
jgi:hypothetical protein